MISFTQKNIAHPIIYSTTVWLFCLTIIQASPYALESLSKQLGEEITFSYDSAGNRLSQSDGLTVNVGLIGKATSLRQGTAKPEQIHHGPAGLRYLREKPDDSKTLYLNAGLTEYRFSSAGAEYSHYIRLGHYSPVARVVLTPNNPATNYLYYLKDHLGSPVQTVSDQGVRVIKPRHTPWGHAVDSQGITVESDKQNPAFTGHENLVTGGLIQMNNRLYHPDSGFLAADPVVQQDKGLPGINRYIYVRNRPLNRIDSTGLMDEPAEQLNINQLMARRLGHPEAPGQRAVQQIQIFTEDTADLYTSQLPDRASQLPDRAINRILYFDAHLTAYQELENAQRRVTRAERAIQNFRGQDEFRNYPAHFNLVDISLHETMTTETAERVAKTNFNHAYNALFHPTHEIGVAEILQRDTTLRAARQQLTVAQNNRIIANRNRGQRIRLQNELQFARQQLNQARTGNAARAHEINARTGFRLHLPD